MQPSNGNILSMVLKSEWNNGIKRKQWHRFNLCTRIKKLKMFTVILKRKLSEHYDSKFLHLRHNKQIHV
jgi:hypothetical protein